MKHANFYVLAFTFEIISLASAIQIVQLLGGISSFVLSAIGIYRLIKYGKPPEHDKK